MKNDTLKTAVVGAGYVGVATEVGLAEQGRDRLDALADGRIPFHEPGLPEAYAAQHQAGRLVPRADIPSDGLDLGMDLRRRLGVLRSWDSVPIATVLCTDAVRVLVSSSSLTSTGRTRR